MKDLTVLGERALVAHALLKELSGMEEWRGVEWVEGYADEIKKGGIDRYLTLIQWRRQSVRLGMLSFQAELEAIDGFLRLNERRLTGEAEGDMQIWTRIYDLDTEERLIPYKDLPLYLDGRTNTFGRFKRIPTEEKGKE